MLTEPKIDELMIKKILNSSDIRYLHNCLYPGEKDVDYAFVSNSQIFAMIKLKEGVGYEIDKTDLANIKKAIRNINKLRYTEWEATSDLFSLLVEQSKDSKQGNFKSAIQLFLKLCAESRLIYKLFEGEQSCIFLMPQMFRNHRQLRIVKVIYDEIKIVDNFLLGVNQLHEIDKTLKMKELLPVEEMKLKVASLYSIKESPTVLHQVANRSTIRFSYVSEEDISHFFKVTKFPDKTKKIYLGFVLTQSDKNVRGTVALYEDKMLISTKEVSFSL